MAREELGNRAVSVFEARTYWRTRVSHRRPAAAGRDSGAGRVVYTLVPALMLSCVGCAGPVGEFVLSAYGGGAFQADVDLQLENAGGTDLEFHDVQLDDESFQHPMYAGARGSYWFGAYPEWGLALDYTHAKAIVDTGQVTRVEGTKNGVDVSGTGPISDHLDRFQMANGHNFWTFNVMHRRFPAARDESWLGRMQPYVGVGGGAVVPYVRATVDGVPTRGYQLAGPAAQGFVGLNVDLLGPFALFGEYKITYADIEVDLRGDGSLATETLTSQLILGISLSTR